MKNLRIDTDKEKIDYEFQADPAGYFLIYIAKLPGQVAVCHMNEDNTPGGVIILGTIGENIRNRIDTLFELTQAHAMYLGAEIERALLCAKFDIPYVQDEPLPIWSVIPFMEENNV
jgi:hypothetical protein